MTHLTISISDEVSKGAKERLKGRISAICESALSKKLNLDITTAEELRVCYSCGKNKENMIWDGIRGCWVCGTCCKSKIRHVCIAVRK